MRGGNLQHERSGMGDNSRMSAVLIVEDSENSAALLEIAFLGIPGVRVLTAPSAAEALRILVGGSGPVRVMVTDLNMPRMDGYELIRRVRADQRLSGMPIIVVSADTDPATPERVVALGAEAFFAKPFRRRWCAGNWSSFSMAGRT